MTEPLYTADEMKAAEAGHDVGEMMARAGRAVAEEALRRYRDARRFVAVLGGGANGGDGRIALEVLESAGKAVRTADEAPLAEADVVIDALDSDAELTWMVGDDIEADIAGAHGSGLRTVLVRTGKFRPDAVEVSRVHPDGIITSIAALPGWIETAT